MRDQAGAPIANAQVYVVGTAFNALTNPQGYYFINNIPAGTVAVRAAFIGYKSTQVEGVKMLAGQTITVDVQLEQTAVEIEEITVVTNTQPLVPRDEVTTKQRVDGQFADNLPVDRINEVLRLQPGVTADNNGNLSIRGGRNNEAATYVDGVPTQAGYRGDRYVGSAGTSLSISTNAFEEASVTTGSSSAEFGNAKSGIINIVTKTGGSEYNGSFSAQTDEPFGVNNSIGFNRLEGSFSGPLAGRLTFALSGALEGQKAVEEGFGSADVPVFLQAGVDTVVNQLSVLDDPATEDVNEQLTADTTQVAVYNYAISRGKCDAFADAGAAGLASGDARTQASVNNIRNNYGLDCNGVRLPATAKTLYQASGKLNYTYGTGSRVSLSLATSRNHGHTFPFTIRYINNLALPSTLQGFNARNYFATLQWTQNLSKSSERALALDVALSYQQDKRIDSPLTTESDLSTRDPFGGFIIKPMHFLFDFDNFPIDDQLIDNVRRNSGRITPVDVDNGSAYNLVDDVRNNAYGLYGQYANFVNTQGGDTWSFGESGGPSNGTTNSRLSLYKENRYIGKAKLDWQADRYNRLNIGGEFTRYGIDNYSFSFTSKFFSEAYREKPIRWNAYVEDRLDLGDVVLVGGLRYDYYDTRASRPFATDTAGNTYAFPRISSLPGFDAANPTALYVRDKSHNYLSPHVQVSFPVTDRTNFRLSYAHQVQTPDFALLLGGINTDLGNTNTNNVFGSDLDFGKTITFEFGIRHAFSDDMVLDVAAYNKDIISDPAARLVTLFDPALRRDTDFRILTNLDFGNVRGLDVRLDRRFGNFFNGTVSYSYQQAKSTGSDPFTYVFYGSRIVNQVGGNNGAQPPPQGIIATDNSRPHTLASAFSVTFPGDFRQGSALGTVLRNVSLFTTFRYTSGTAYSKCGAESNEEQSIMSIENCNALFPEGINSQRLPAFKELNTKLTKSFGLGGLDVTGYLDVRNLLNFKNVIQVFAVNGDVSNAEERQQNLQSDLDDLASERDQNGALGAVGPDGAINLNFAHETCNNWVSSKNDPAAANCIYLIRAEERYGNGDHVYTVEEQTRAINALYDVARGTQEQYGAPRRARLGFEINF
ncbi:MAG TPA: carboxypeptidase regulatory-like domain-containing protein [Gemmatimonadales bacterium]|nr:carboxypeptidase regulatory-like domain-containing protein [Gemmatimonadales bacterium]